MLENHEKGPSLFSKSKVMSLNVLFCQEKNKIYSVEYDVKLRKAGNLQQNSSIFCHFCVKNYFNDQSIIIIIQVYP